MAKYMLIDLDGGARLEIEAEDDHDAIESAHDWARDGWAHDWSRDGEYSDSTTTLWVDTRVREVCPECGGEGEHEFECDSRPALLDTRVTTQIDPDEPSCTESEHDWQRPHAIVGGIVENPGVHGHGGGVIVEDVCMHCGCARITDTWAQRRDTGEQGLESVSYWPNKYADEVAALRADEDDAA